MGTAPAVRPRLKSVTVNRSGAHVVIERGALERLHLEDDSGALTALLTLLTTGQHERPALSVMLTQQGFPVTTEEVDAALTELDRLGLLEQADAELTLDPDVLERHRSNLRFYDLFSNLGQTSVDLLHAANRGHVLILGAGGMGSGVLQSLAGLAVRKVTIVDCDVVESKNLARQFLYGPDSIGQPKVECAARWMRSYAPDTEVVAVHQRITDAASIVALAGDADVVVSAIDSPEGIQLIVNEACFKLGVPYVLAGLRYSTLSYRSIHPGVSPCRRCLDLHHRDQESDLPDALLTDPIIEPPSVNRATGPVVQLAAGFVSLEVMRYLIGIEPPVAAATYHVLELAGGMATRRAAWQHHPECELCPPKP